MIRYINIEGIDKNACCGTQLPHLGHLSFLHIIPPSTPATSTAPTKTPTRLFFVSGPRAIRFSQHSSRQLSLAAQSILVSRNELVERVEKMDNQRREIISRERDLRTELARTIGENLTVPEPWRVVYLKRAERSTHDFEFLGNIAAATNGARAVILVSALPGVSPSLILVQSPDADLAKGLNDQIKAALNDIKAKGEDEELRGPRYKGGGAKGRFMGKLEGKWGKEEDEVLKAVVDKLQQDQ